MVSPELHVASPDMGYGVQGFNARCTLGDVKASAGK
jgi:hypothetical protein